MTPSPLPPPGITEGELTIVHIGSTHIVYIEKEAIKKLKEMNETLITQELTPSLMLLTVFTLIFVIH